jgi:hypothetical protein
VSSTDDDDCDQNDKLPRLSSFDDRADASTGDAVWARMIDLLTDKNV